MFDIVPIHFYKSKKTPLYTSRAYIKRKLADHSKLFAVKMAGASKNAVIVILTQNTAARRIYLKTTLYFLFRHFNARFQYPIMILHEGDYDSRAQDDIISGIRGAANKSLIQFVTLDKTDFEIPEHVDKEKMARCIDLQPVPYWRNDKYRLMCRFFCINLWKYVSGYEYVMRIDDDGLIEQPIGSDFFAEMKRNGLVYASNIMHMDCGICCYGMRDFFEREFPDKKKTIAECFVSSEIDSSNVAYYKIRSWLSIFKDPLPDRLPSKIALHSPIIFFNNFFVTKVSFWERPDVRETMRKIDLDGGFYYARYGDAPIHSVMVALFAKSEEISRFSFRYSKRLQREGFEAPDGRYHEYHPVDYEDSSCITQRGEQRT